MLPDLLRDAQATREALSRACPISQSPRAQALFADHARRTLAALEQAPLTSNADRADALLLRHLLTTEDRRPLDPDLEALIPALPNLITLADRKYAKSLPDPESDAARYAKTTQALRTSQSRLEHALRDSNPRDICPEPRARRAALLLKSLSEHLEHSHQHASSYHPLYSWWCNEPHRHLTNALAEFTTWLEQEFIPTDHQIPGEPVGRDGLLDDLHREMLSCTPEELLAIGQREWEWCVAERDRISRELGFERWQDALDHVKSQHVAPGEQPKLVIELAEEAIAFLEKRDLITLPHDAKTTWRLVMMSPEMQRTAPFFLGGEAIWVSYPTDTMTHEQKLMAMRGNNRHFARATVHHELIPGHHLQFYAFQRHNTHRHGLIGTPFWIEGWALYWELLFYRNGFVQSLEDQLGFLFWRSHRAARIVFSLRFHLGEMSTADCVQMLVEEVGHEQSTAEGEVRRSFNGDWPPLYQLAYLIGAIQMVALRNEVVSTKRLFTEKEFHDRVLTLGQMPWSVVRALLLDEEINPNTPPTWNWDPGRPVDDLLR